MSIILSLAGDGGVPSDLLARQGYRQVARISGKEVVRIFGTRRSHARRSHSLDHLPGNATCSRPRSNAFYVAKVFSTIWGVQGVTSPPCPSFLKVGFMASQVPPRPRSRLTSPAAVFRNRVSRAQDSQRSFVCLRSPISSYTTSATPVTAKAQSLSTSINRSAAQSF
jgi:hypothetical protein